MKPEQLLNETIELLEEVFTTTLKDSAKPVDTIPHEGYYYISENMANKLKRQIVKYHTRDIDNHSDLVSFGSYLLSEQRRKTIQHMENLDKVKNTDIENWKHLKNNIQNN